MITLVLGGTRSGKSEVAERLVAAAPGGPATVVVTALTGADADLDERVAAHRARRPPSWRTVECGAELVAAVAAAPPGPLLVDSLGTWVGATPGMAVDAGALVRALRARRGDAVVVSEEVGLSVHPPHELGRRFVDVLGVVNREVADAADEVLLVVAGRVLPLARPEA